MMRTREATAANPFRLIGFSSMACNAAVDPFSREHCPHTAAEKKKHRRDFALTLMIDSLFR
jgi:hypothetical protein